MDIKNNKNGYNIVDAIVGFAGIVLGILAAGIPQVVMNYKNLGSFSIGVPTNGLMLQQMFWGIKYQRYDTYIPRGTDTVHPDLQVFFTDAAGVKILQEMNLNSSKWLLGVIGFSTLFISVLSMALNSCRSWKMLGWLTPVLIPSILIIPGAVEYRFSIGIYFYFIMNLCFNIDWKGFVLKIIILGLCFAIWSSMLSGEAITPLTF